MQSERRIGNMEKRGFAEIKGERMSLTQKGREFLRKLSYGRYKRVAMRFGLNIDEAKKYEGIFRDSVPRELHYRKGIDFLYHP